MKLFSVSAAYLAIPLALIVSAQTETATQVGCYADSANFQNKGSYTYQSLGYCATLCGKAKTPYMALHDGTECWCGTSLPDKSSLQSDDKCNTTCSGWPEDKCGSDKAWSVYQLPANAKEVSESASTSTSLASATPGSNSTASATKSGSASQSASSAGATPTTSTSAATRRFKLPFFL
ncbi:WSC domain-containing protein [Aspergillus arachidicola]|uniref:Plasma membrane sensor transducer n=1 Tax=Aspergillus arachidicola TaxID=656916 RepID=A0A2G7G253_9EURO|nr:WSC domain-containing protein [Aspergillus arachidicola]PIG86930.1 plasma membrane sensor transducer [Aspergillus arachidicola]